MKKLVLSEECNLNFNAFLVILRRLGKYPRINLPTKEKKMCLVLNWNLTIIFPVIICRLSSQLQHRDGTWPSLHPNSFFLVHFVVFTTNRRGRDVIVVTLWEIGNILRENICNAIYVMQRRVFTRRSNTWWGWKPPSPATH